MANHTSIRSLFVDLMKDYRRFKDKNAHLHHYQETRLFQDSLEEFDSAEEVVKNLIDEYAAAETSGYIEWGQGGKHDDSMF